MSTRLADERGYAAEMAISAPVERVFAALITLDGLASWWTPEVSGSPERGGELTFGFGPDKAELLVAVVVPPTSVVWTCLGHSKFQAWQNTTLIFEVRTQDASSALVTFRHVGLVPTLACFALCSRGRDHYLDSLAAHVEGKGGSPWGSQQQQAVKVALSKEVKHDA